MYVLNGHDLNIISGGESCELITHVYNYDPNNFFEYNSSITGDCDALQAALDAGEFNGSKEMWEGLGYTVEYNFVKL